MHLLLLDGMKPSIQHQFGIILESIMILKPAMSNCEKTAFIRLVEII